MRNKITKTPPMFHGAEPHIFQYAESLRENATKAEQLLWGKLRNKQLSGFKFRRQHPLDKFIADFYCHAEKLIVELDGGYHSEKAQKERDELRAEIIATGEIEIIRFENEGVFERMDFVITEILNVLETK